MPYIDKNELLNGIYSDNPTDVMLYIARFPTADVQEVVTCKDCIHGIPTRIDTVTGEFSDERYCNRHHMCHLEDYYCADGKRKEGGADASGKG